MGFEQGQGGERKVLLSDVDGFPQKGGKIQLLKTILKSPFLGKDVGVEGGTGRVQQTLRQPRLSCQRDSGGGCRTPEN
jgi:hypothetical protein